MKYKKKLKNKWKNKKYINGIIYKITHNTLPNIVYIGSTFCRLSTRWKNHKKNYIGWKNGYIKGKCSICVYFEQYGIKNFKCEVIKKYKVVDSKHLNAYEQLYLNKIKNINKNKVFNPITNLKKKLFRC